MSEKKTNDVEPPSRGILAEIGRSFVQGAKESLFVALVGAVIGAVVLGGFGGKYFGWSGLGVGILAGALVGAMVGWWLYASVY